MKIAILGAGKVGMTLLSMLEGTNYDIVVVDKSKEVCDALASESRAVLVCGDCTDPATLDGLRLADKDFVVAVSGEEEVNFLAAAYAKQAGARRVIARSHSRKHAALLSKLGISGLIPEVTLAKELANQIMNPTISLMLNPGESNLELFEADIPQKMNGKSVVEAIKDPGVSILALFDGEKFTLPKPADELKAGTRAVAVSTTGKRSLQ
ncbi:MAG: TrkA family potassium uptake protein [Candidatus Micrarchaeota archaeon]